MAIPLTNRAAQVSEDWSAMNQQGVHVMLDFFPALAGTFTGWWAETLRFGAKRAAEYRQLPARLANCESAAGLFAEQMRFFSTMREDYAGQGNKLLEMLANPPSARPATDLSLPPKKAPFAESSAVKTEQSPAAKNSRTAA